MVWAAAAALALAACGDEPLGALNGLEGAEPAAVDEALLGNWRVTPDIDPDNPPRRPPPEMRLEVSAHGEGGYAVRLIRGAREWAYQCTPYTVAGATILDCVETRWAGGDAPEGLRPPHHFLRIAEDDDGGMAIEWLRQGWADALHEAGECPVPYTMAGDAVVPVADSAAMPALIEQALEADVEEGAWHRLGLGIEREDG